MLRIRSTSYQKIGPICDLYLAHMDPPLMNSYMKLRVEHITVNTWHYNISYYKYSAQEFVAVIRDSARTIVHIRGDNSMDRLSSLVNSQISDNLVLNTDPFDEADHDSM